MNNSNNKMSKRDIVLMTVFATAITALASTSLSNERNGEEGISIISLFDHNNPDGTPKVDPKYDAYRF